MFTNNILSIVTWLPALGAILILGLFRKEQNDLIKKFATAWLVLDFVASLWLLGYDRGIGGMQFLEDHQWIPAIGARYQMGADGVSVLLIVLTTFLGVLAALSSWKYIQKREKEYYILLLLLQAFVLGVFSSMDLFLFYLFFEVSLVPMYFLIGIWGGENRLYAAIKFFLYTLVGSVVMLLGVLKMYFLTQDTALAAKISQSTISLLAGNPNAAELVNNTVKAAVANGTGNFNLVYLQAIGSVLPMGTLQVLLFFAFALGFAIKVPMFPFHTWLPDAHVEAPTAGSVILAGVLLKLGTYGFYRFNLPMFPKASADESFFFQRHESSVRRAQCDDLSGDRLDHLWRAGGDVLCGKEGRRRQEAGCLLIGFFHGDCHAGSVRAESQRAQRRDHADGQSRYLLSRAVPAGGNCL